MTKIEWYASCVKCKFIGKFESITGVEYKEFLEILREECPECLGKLELKILDSETLFARCRNCSFLVNIGNLKNVEEKYLKDKEYRFLYILPKCPKCGSACRVFPTVV